MKAFIFDFDGVIVDSEKEWRKSAKILFPTFVPGWTEKDSTRLTGLGFKAAYNMLVQEYGFTMDYEQYVEKRRSFFTDTKADENILPIHGLMALLDRLRGMNIAIGIGSSASRHWIDRTLSRHRMCTCWQQRNWKLCLQTVWFWKTPTTASLLLKLPI